MRRVMCGIALAGCALSVAAKAQPSRRVPVRSLGPVVAATKESLGTVFGVWQFADGRVLINDGQRRRMFVFDSALTSFEIIADTLAAAPIRYMRISTPIIPFIGDSLLFPDQSSSTLLLLSPGGKVARAIAMAKTSDMTRLFQSASSAANGSLVYRSFLPPRPASPAATAVDSAPLVRANFDTRTIDTLTLVKVPTTYRYRPVVDRDGKTRPAQTIVPVATVDEWAMLSDGTIAVLRGIDYHIDWINVDGSRTRTAKIPFDWRPLTQTDKTRMIDSIKAAWEAQPLVARTFTMGEAASAMSSMGVPTEQWSIVTLPDGTKGVPMDLIVAPPEEMPDYFPSIRSGAMKADRDGNLWILPNTSAQSRTGGLVYDIVNRRGELTERVELPAGRSIAGFGPGGNVYLMSGDRVKGFTVERARFK